MDVTLNDLAVRIAIHDWQHTECFLREQGVTYLNDVHFLLSRMSPMGCHFNRSMQTKTTPEGAVIFITFYTALIKCYTRFCAEFFEDYGGWTKTSE